MDYFLRSAKRQVRAKPLSQATGGEGQICLLEREPAHSLKILRPGSTRSGTAAGVSDRQPARDDRQPARLSENWWQTLPIPVKYGK